MKYDVVVYFENMNYPMTYLLDKPSFDALIDMMESDVPGTLTMTNHWNLMMAMLHTEKIVSIEWDELEEEDDE